MMMMTATATRGGGGGGGGGFSSSSSLAIKRRLRQGLGGRALRVKFLLLSCISLALALILASLLAGILLQRYAPFPPPLSSVVAPRKQYTILINTWKRNDLLKICVAHYASCSGVDSIHIVWSERDPPPNSLLYALRQNAKLKSNSEVIRVVFDLNKEDSLNNRFKEIKDLRTDAILSIDDDVIIPCRSVEFAFDVWQSAPATMVGFVPRMHWFDKSQGGLERYRYGGWWSVWWMGTYSMVLSKAAFFHSNYLALYSKHMPSSIREYITNDRNCEDIALSFLVANFTGSPPIWVKGHVFEIGSTGISSLGGHSRRRSKCLNLFAALYGYMPLKATNLKAIDSRGSWFW